MWANAVVPGLAPITIHAEYLKTGGKVVGDEPTVDLFSAAAVYPTIHVAPMLGTVVVDVVNGEERWFCFTAAGAYIAAICVVTFILEPLVIAPSVFTVPFKIGETPFSHALGSNAGVSLFPPLLCCLYPVGVGKRPLAVLFSDIYLVSPFP